MTSLYAQYIAEREEFATLEEEHGFAIYAQVDKDTFYLRDIFVEAGFRKEGIAKALSASVAQIAKDAGATRLTGSIDLNAPNVTVSMAALLGDGFKFSHANNNMLYFLKDI